MAAYRVLMACISAVPASAAHGTGARVTFTGVASGCPNPNPLYEFWFNNGSGWQVVQGLVAGLDLDLEHDRGAAGQLRRQRHHDVQPT
jgi:hypothetical protein